jgi:hypothetical protein
MAMAELAALVEERLGGVMLIRLELTTLLERLKHEEHALATSMKSILMWRDQERAAYEAQLEAVNNYARQLESQLQNPAAPALPSAPPPAGTWATSAHPSQAHDLLPSLPTAGGQSFFSAPLHNGASVPPPVPCVTSPGLTSPGWGIEASAGIEAPQLACGGRQGLEALSATVPPAAAKAAWEGARFDDPAGGIPQETRGAVAPIATATSQGLKPPVTAGRACSDKPPEQTHSPSECRTSVAAAHQLQQRLARERSHLVASPAQAPAGAIHPPLGAAAIASRNEGGGADPFDHFEQGGLHDRARSKLAASLQFRPETPSNPAVVTADGATFQFRHSTAGRAS